MRSYKTVKEILSQVSLWHHRLLEHCCEGDDPDEDDPFRPLVDYLAGHERAAKHVLDRYKPAERDTILNTWLQYVPAEQVDEVFTKRDFSAEMKPQEIVTMILEFDNALVELYKTLANQSQAHPRINELFQGLLEMEEWQRLRNAFAARESDTFATGRG
ncbi:MAG: hypothetical protein M3552_12000 [Planctomycetota bacterium]|nr:hypothetical protein [Planctomycetaceae bacterium]MDQ3331357.1 hypothetical protein [Planctomycetota bacterium]